MPLYCIIMSVSMSMSISISLCDVMCGVSILKIGRHCRIKLLSKENECFISFHFMPFNIYNIQYNNTYTTTTIQYIYNKNNNLHQAF